MVNKDSNASSGSCFVRDGGGICCALHQSVKTWWYDHRPDVSTIATSRFWSICSRCCLHTKAFLPPSSASSLSVLAREGEQVNSSTSSGLSYLSYLSASPLPVHCLQGLSRTGGWRQSRDACHSPSKCMRTIMLEWVNIVKQRFKTDSQWDSWIFLQDVLLIILRVQWHLKD